MAELQPLDPSRPIYQKKDGYPSMVITYPIPGGVNECRLPDPVTIAELKHQIEQQSLRHKQKMKEQADEHKNKEHAAGSLAVIIGWALVAFGAAAHFATSIPLVKSWSSSIITLGVFAIIGGLGLQMTVEYDWFLKLTFAIVFIIWIAYRLYKHRDFHLPDKIQKFKDIKNRNTKPRSGSQADTK